MLTTFITSLTGLQPGQSLTLSRDRCDHLFEPGLDTAEGRRHMYAVASVGDCEVRWQDDEKIEFRKRTLGNKAAG